MKPNPDTPKKRCKTVRKTKTTKLERQIGAFVDYYNNEGYQESLNNVSPPDVYFGRDKAIIRERAKNKKLTIQNRRLQHQK